MDGTIGRDIDGRKSSKQPTSTPHTRAFAARMKAEGRVRPSVYIDGRLAGLIEDLAGPEHGNKGTTYEAALEVGGRILAAIQKHFPQIEPRGLTASDAVDLFEASIAAMLAARPGARLDQLGADVGDLVAGGRELEEIRKVMAVTEARKKEDTRAAA